MILIADSGSTKTDWAIISGTNIKKFTTSGINPFYLNSIEISQILQDEFPDGLKNNFANMWFYGAGCTPEKKNIVFQALQTSFNSLQINVESDLLGTARALCGNEKGIACILGTGSNSCYYNGTSIESNVSPLGYILGDEGSGAVLGKRFLADLLKNQLSNEIASAFFESIALTPAELLHRIYREPLPNRFMASITPFLKKWESNQLIYNLIHDEFNRFISRNILQYPQSSKILIHFSGSIAFHFSAILKDVLLSNHLTPGIIVKNPLDSLIDYHTR